MAFAAVVEVGPVGMTFWGDLGPRSAGGCTSEHAPGFPGGARRS